MYLRSLTAALLLFGFLNLQADAGEKDNRIQAQGILHEIETAAARFALSDRDGKVLYLLTPPAGMDMASHIGTYISVRGHATYLADYDVLHIQSGAATESPDETQDGSAKQVAYEELALLDPQPSNEEPDDATPEAIPDESVLAMPSECGCDTCGGCSCGSCCCVETCGPPHDCWLRGEYLLWWMDGMRTPPLVTTANTAAELRLPTGRVIYGHEDILDDERSGWRIRAGKWLDCEQKHGVEGEYIGFGDESERFVAASDGTGNPIFGRPFFNLNPLDPGPDGMIGTPDDERFAREAAEIVSAPNLLAGSVTVDSLSRFDSAGVRYLRNLCCADSCCTDCCGDSWYRHSRIDFILGYRYAGLRENLLIREDLTSIEPPGPLTDPGQRFNIFDQFTTRNQFHGPEIGILWQATRGCWTMEFLGKMAIGNNRQVVTINGQTVRFNSTDPNDDGTFVGGLLAQSSNIGVYRRDDFTVIPELGATLGWQVNRCLRATLGYSFLYWSQVVRPGDQINRDINGDLLPPPANPITGALRPTFAFNPTDFWAHGLNFGLEVRW